MATKLTDEEKAQLDLGKKIQEFYNLGYINKKQALTFTLYKGIASGLGVVIGGTIIIALLIWILGQFAQVPLIGPFVDSIKHTLDSKN